MNYEPLYFLGSCTCTSCAILLCYFNHFFHPSSNKKGSHMQALNVFCQSSNFTSMYNRKINFTIYIVTAEYF